MLKYINYIQSLMSNFMNKNKFTYVNYADRKLLTDLLYWQEKITDYLEEYYDGNPANARKSKFGDCMGKSLNLLETATDNRAMFRGVVNNNMLQAGVIIEYRIGEIYLYEEQQQHILLDIVCSAPWNCLAKSLPETCKGSAEWLIADIIQEMISADSRVNGILKVAAVPRAIEFYQRISFEENPDGSGEMILTEEKALQFLEEHIKRWR
jgi:hypothetical protein